MFPDLELVYGKWEFSFDFNRQHFHIGRVIHHINDPAGKADSQVVFVSTKANAAAFIRLSLFTVQKRPCKNCGIQKMRRHGVTFKRNLRRGSQCTVDNRVVAFREPCVELYIQFFHGTGQTQRNLLQKSIQRMVEAFLFSLALGIARLCINQADSQNPAGPLHPLVFVL